MIQGIVNNCTSYAIIKVKVFVMTNLQLPVNFMVFSQSKIHFCQPVTDRGNLLFGVFWICYSFIK